MKKIKPKTYIPHKNLDCGWTDRKKFLIQYRMLKFYVRHAIIVEKVHEIISFKQSKWLENIYKF